MLSEVPWKMSEESGTIENTELEKIVNGEGKK